MRRRKCKWIVVAIVVLLAAGGMAYAMRMNVGASQRSRVDIGAAQESQAGRSSPVNSSVFHSPVFGGQVVK